MSLRRGRAPGRDALTVAPGEPLPLGLVAGQGALPLLVARAARRGGRRVAAIAFRGRTDPALEAGAEVTWLHLGEVGAALDALRGAGVHEAVLAGKVPRADLFESAAMRPDAEARRLLAGLPDGRDGTLLLAVARLLEGRGIRLLPQAELVPELVGGEGVQGARAPDAAQRADLALGFRVARAVAGLDVGQTVVVRQGAVLAVEAIEGTDAAIRRGGAAAPGACVVKVARPGQDPRFDLPVLGPGSLRAAREAGVAVLAYEAGRTLLLEREALVAGADAAGVALVGLREDALPGDAP